MENGACMQVILEHLHWRDLGKLMRGEEGDSSESHSHSNYAFRMLQQFRVGRVTEYERYSCEVSAAVVLVTSTSDEKIIAVEVTVDPVEATCKL